VGIEVLQDVMARGGWEVTTDPPDPCCIQAGTFGLMRRNDEWAAFDSGASISGFLADSLGVGELSRAVHELIAVWLEYTDRGVGRRQSFD
jgi:hypothetical protein